MEQRLGLGICQRRDESNRWVRRVCGVNSRSSRQVGWEWEYEVLRINTRDDIDIDQRFPLCLSHHSTSSPYPPNLAWWSFRFVSNCPPSFGLQPGWSGTNCCMYAFELCGT